MTTLCIRSGYFCFFMLFWGVFSAAEAEIKVPGPRSELPEVNWAIDWSELEARQPFFDLVLKWRVTAKSLRNSGLSRDQIIAELEKKSPVALAAARSEKATDARLKLDLLKGMLDVHAMTLAELAQRGDDFPALYEISARRHDAKELVESLQISKPRAERLFDRWQSETSAENKISLLAEPLSALRVEAVRSSLLPRLEKSMPSRFSATLYQAALRYVGQTERTRDEYKIHDLFAFSKKLVLVKETDAGFPYFQTIRGEQAEQLRNRVAQSVSYAGLLEFARSQSDTALECEVATHDGLPARAKVNAGALLLAAFSNEDGRLGDGDFSQATAPVAKGSTEGLPKGTENQKHFFIPSKLVEWLRGPGSPKAELKESYARITEVPSYPPDHPYFHSLARDSGRFEFQRWQANSIPVREAESESTLFFADPSADSTGGNANMNSLLQFHGGVYPRNFFQPSNTRSITDRTLEFGLKRPFKRILSLVVGGHGCGGVLGVSAGQSAATSGNSLMPEEGWTMDFIREINKNKIVIERIMLLGCSVAAGVTVNGPHVMRTLAAGLNGRPRVSAVDKLLNVPAAGYPSTDAGGLRVVVRLKSENAKSLL